MKVVAVSRLTLSAYLHSFGLISATTAIQPSSFNLLIFITHHKIMA